VFIMAIFCVYMYLRVRVRVCVRVCVCIHTYTFTRNIVRMPNFPKFHGVHSVCMELLFDSVHARSTESESVDPLLCKAGIQKCNRIPDNFRQ
jgi:hypothetical protein